MKQILINTFIIVIFFAIWLGLAWYCGHKANLVWTWLPAVLAIQVFQDQF